MKVIGRCVVILIFLVYILEGGVMGNLCCFQQLGLLLSLFDDNRMMNL